jgi:hypothetical protein
MKSSLTEAAFQNRLVRMLPARAKRVMIGCVAGVLALCAVGILLPAFTPASNCGGNSAALTACRSVAICFQLAAVDHRNRPVAVGEMTAAELAEFGAPHGLNWLHDSTVLVTAAKVSVGEAGGREVIAVCNRAYDNVPRRWLIRAPFTHAVAYADGSTGLISPDEFRRLDLTRFLDVKLIR